MLLHVVQVPLLLATIAESSCMIGSSLHHDFISCGYLSLVASMVRSVR